MSVEKFEVGKYYRCVRETPNPLWDGDNGAGGGMMIVLDHKARKCIYACAEINHGGHETTFEGVERKDGIWKCWYWDPSDFEEVKTEGFGPRRFGKRIRLLEDKGQGHNRKREGMKGFVIPNESGNMQWDNGETSCLGYDSIIEVLDEKEEKPKKRITAHSVAYGIPVPIESVPVGTKVRIVSLAKGDKTNELMQSYIGKIGVKEKRPSIMCNNAEQVRMESGVLAGFWHGALVEIIKEEKVEEVRWCGSCKHQKKAGNTSPCNNCSIVGNGKDMGWERKESEPCSPPQPYPPEYGDMTGWRILGEDEIIKDDDEHFWGVWGPTGYAGKTVKAAKGLQKGRVKDYRRKISSMDTILGVAAEAIKRGDMVHLYRGPETGFLRDSFAPAAPSSDPAYVSPERRCERRKRLLNEIKFDE